MALRPVDDGQRPATNCGLGGGERCRPGLRSRRRRVGRGGAARAVAGGRGRMAVVSVVSGVRSRLGGVDGGGGGATHTALIIPSWL